MGGGHVELLMTAWPREPPGDFTSGTISASVKGSVWTEGKAVRSCPRVSDGQGLLKGPALPRLPPWCRREGLMDGLPWEQSCR